MRQEIYDGMMNYFDVACRIMKDDFNELKKLEEILHVFRVQLQQKQTLSNHFERRNLLWKEI